MRLFRKAMLGIVETSLIPLILTWVPSADAQTLTGVNLSRADSNGNSQLNAYAATVGGNNTNELLYGLAGLPAASLSTNNPFLNSGNLSTAPTRIALGLSTPGTYSYTFLSDTGSNGEISYGTGEVGLNLFFDGNDVTPDISALAYANATSTSNYPSFTANSAPTTATLNPLVTGGVKGAGTLSFVDGGNRITLTEFRDTTANIYNVDRVGEFSLGANGNHDSVLEFSLQVVAIPEPTSLLLAFGAGALLLLGRSRRPGQVSGSTFSPAN
jgi:hypothetical protein